MEWNDWIKAFLSYGVLGLAVVGFLTGWIVAKPTHQREILRADKAEALAKQLSDLLDRMARGSHP